MDVKREKVKSRKGKKREKKTKGGCRHQRKGRQEEIPWIM